MFDTMTLTKAVGGFCGALLFFLLGQWAAETIYQAGGGHGDGHEQAYVIDTGEDEAEEPAEEEAGPDFAELFVSADAGKGERVFNQCAACHKVEEGANGVGPYLHGVVGRAVGVAEGYASYSGNLSDAADRWTPRELNAFLENPSEYAPGTTMGYGGLDDVEDRANVIAYLDQTDGDTYEIEVSGAEETADAADAGADEGAGQEETAEAESTADEATAEAPQEPEAEGTSETDAEPVTDGATEETAETADAGEEAAAADTGAAEEGAEDAATEEAAAEENTDGQSGFAAMVAAADPADGKKVYRQCQACHVADKKQNRVGPHLVDTVGRKVASVESYGYSDALKGVGGDWTLDKLSAWLENPMDYAPGTKMGYAGLDSGEDRAAVIAYLQSLSN